MNKPKTRAWIILAVIVAFAILNPTIFRDYNWAEEDQVLLETILTFVASLALTYFYFLPVKTIPRAEKFIMPAVLWPFTCVVMSVLMKNIFDRVFPSEYDTGADNTEVARTITNLVYYLLLTVPLIGLMKLYVFIRRHPE